MHNTKVKISLVIIMAFLAGTSVMGAEPRPDSLSVTTDELADKMIEQAKKYLGAPYRHGGKGPDVFDCSGFTRFIYSQFGYSLSGSAIVQSGQGREVEGSISNLQKGDLIFFGSRNNVRKLGHVALYIGPDESGDGFNFIHATVHGGVLVSNSKEKYYSTRFLGARRILPDFYAPGDTAAAADSLSNYGKKMVVDSCDTLHLDADDRRIVLLANGSWIYVNSDGQVMKPETAEKIVLDSNGQWMSIPYSTHAIPSLSNPVEVQPAKKASSTESSSVKYYTVKSGDTLSKIAKRFHTSVSALCRLNGVKSTTVLKIGRRIRVK